MDDYDDPMEDIEGIFDNSQMDDQALNNLFSENQDILPDGNNIDLSDDIVINGFNSDIDYFGLPYPVIDLQEGTCEIPDNASFYNEDIIGAVHQQMMDMGLSGEDAFNLVMAHESSHKALQEYNMQDPWEHELACDYFTGVRAAMQHVDLSNYENTIINSSLGDTHPTRTVRVELMEYGKQVAQDLEHEGIHPTFEKCLELFSTHFHESSHHIQHQGDTSSTEEVYSTLSYNSQISFTGKYTESEISKLESDVKDLKYDLSYKDSDVEHHQRCVDLVDTPKGHMNGEYEYEVKQLNKSISDREYTVSKLNDAIERLNNAI